jgi:hypothetical protein
VELERDDAAAVGAALPDTVPSAPDTDALQPVTNAAPAANNTPRRVTCGPSIRPPATLDPTSAVSSREAYSLVGVRSKQ